jgi:hypothetical protein
MMESLLLAMKTTNSNTDSTNQNPLIATKTLEEFVFRYIEYNWNGTEFHVKRENIGTLNHNVIPS